MAAGAGDILRIGERKYRPDVDQQGVT